MTKILYLVLTVPLMMLLQTTSNAQNCSSSFSPQEFECDGPDGCSEDIYLTIPSGGQYGLNVVCGGFSCCGQLFTSCGGQGNCEAVKVRPPEVKARLTQLSLTSDVLVADCRGRYGPYEPSPGPVVTRRRGTLAALSDRILR